MSTSHRNYRGLNLHNFRKEFNSNRILEKDNLEEAFKEFKEEMTRALDELAPLEDRVNSKRKSETWYNSQLLEQRKVTRNRERAFINIERIITGGHLLENGIDTIKS